MKARLVIAREIAPNTRHFEFEVEDGEARFVPGQFYSVTVRSGEDEVTRAYSIASPPGGDRFSFCANLVPDGRLSPHLFAMNEGDAMEYKGPYGAFILRPDPAPTIFVATGTGIAPFRSMLLAQLESRPAQQFTLVFGVRHEEGILYHDEFLELARTYTNLHYMPTLTRPQITWKGLVGRVQPHVLRVADGRPDVDVYICGLREMVDDMRAQLKALGLDRKRIIYEKYD